MQAAKHIMKKEGDAPRPTLEERRAARKARREKQRLANVGRARKMHETRIAAEHRPEPGEDELPKLNVGCSGWFYWHLRGTFYPQAMPTKDWFGHYAESFRTVELNAPFYSWPTVNAVKQWVRQVEGGPPFIYTVKVCELITHVKRFQRTVTLIKDFGYIADLLGPRMGCFLFQLPPSYHYTTARLKAIVNTCEPGRRNVVEFRHKSWWNEKVYATFRKAGVIFCSSSAPKLPDELIKTHDEIYIRFHGKNRWYRHDYSAEELALWVDRIRESGARRVWAYFNNDWDGYAIKNATQLIRQLESSASLGLP